MKNIPRIVLTGSLAVDRIMVFDGQFKDLIQPDKLHILSISALVDKLRITRGGIAGNIAYSLALLGEKPTLFASIGSDGKEYINSLSQLGVDTSHVHFSELPTASFSVLTDKNDCQVGGFYPGAMSDASALSVHQFSNEEILFVISAHDPSQMAVQIDECANLQKRMCFDIGQQVIALSSEVLKKGIQAAELLVLNDYEMGLLAKQSGLSESEIIHSVKTCVITYGEKGCAVFEQKKNWQKELVQAVKVDQVIDPTGAGDAFRAGFLYGYVRNWPAEKCAQLGSTVAAFVVEKHGTQEHSFTRNELSTRYQKTYQQPIDWSPDAKNS